MSILDGLTILLYFVLVLSAGLWYRRKAAEDMDSYFLGKKRIHWLALAASGAVSNFDITGTMWMVSVFVMLGMQGWWHHWMWGVALPAFALAYMARWVRRSQVMTAAEWMATRFGTGAGGRAARYAYAAMAVIYTVAAVGYTFQGIGKFADVYIPLQPVASVLPFGGAWIVSHQAAILAVIVLAFTTLYVVLGGLYSVVITDAIQTVILTGAAFLIVGIAYVQVSPDVLAAQLPNDFTQFWPSWHRPEMAGAEATAAYEMFGLLVIVWVGKGVLMNAGGPAQLYDFQRYLATKDGREASKVAAAWPFFLVPRWGMIMGIALLAMTGALTTGDPEQVMPMVLQQYLPAGVRGIVIAGLLAAFMSTFSSTVNAGASFVVRDLWEPLIEPDASEERLIHLSYASTVALVLAGIGVGFSTSSIGAVWNWMMMALVAGVTVPNVLRWYWWRLNGWGYAIGTFGGLALSIVALVDPGLPIYVVFPLICLGSLLGSLLGTWWVSPTDREVLIEFYETVNPFGVWGPIAREVEQQSAGSGTSEKWDQESPWRATTNTLIAIVGLTALYLAPMYFVGHWHQRAGLCGIIFAACTGMLYFTWYKYLPPPDPASAE